MATDTAVAPAPTSATTDATRHLWQLPVLLLGFAAFVGTWKGWILIGDPLSPPSPVRDIASLKAAHEKVSPDTTELKNLLSKVAAGVEAYPASDAPQARFHLGSGYVRLAEITAAQDESRGYWMLALQHFDLVTEKQLRDPADGPKLVFRAAKARAAVGLPENTPREEIDQLINVLMTPQLGEEAGESQRLAAELALRLNPPDIHRAKIALTQYLTSTGVAIPAVSLARARLTLGAVYYQSKDYEQARKWLSDIGQDTPAEVMAPAKSLLARAQMAEGNWLAAARELDLLRGAPGVPPPIRLSAAYQLGVCRQKLRDAEAARRLFEEAVKGEGPESTAAAIQLAKVHLEGTDRTRHRAAVDLLVGAFKGVHKPAEYDATFIPLNEAQAVFELAVTTLLTDGEHEPALRAAEAYGAISPPGRDREKRADVLGAWAEALLKSGPPAAAKPKFKDAANEFAALAAFQPKSDGKVEMLRKSAALSRKADDPNAAVERLKDALKLKGIPDPVLQTLWIELADALLAAGNPGEVPILFRKIIAEGGELGTATRYRLARAFVDSRHPGLVQTGRALFEQIAKMQNVERSEREYHERSLTELANVLIREGNFADAESRLRTQLRLYETGPEAPLARLLLGICLLQRAAGANVQPPDAMKMRAEALLCFKRIVADCDVIEQRTKLTDREAWLRLQASLRVLQTHQQMKKPLELLADAAPLLDRHKNTVDELIILSLVFHAFRQMNDPGKALDTRARMKEAFDKLPPQAFTHKDGEYSREYWQKMWFGPDAK